MKIVVYNLGCKVNQYECDAITKLLKQKGHTVSETLEAAECYILNTCAVTNEAERKSRQCVGRALKFNPNARIIVCGCASQNDPSQFIKKDGVTYVSGVAKKIDIVEKLDNDGVFISPLPLCYEDNLNAEVNRTRAYVKIQDGCDRFCSYCLIPYLRGRSRSRDIKSIVEECNELSLKTEEIVLAGVDISTYGKGINTNMSELISALKSLNCRIRLGSIEVSMINEELLKELKALKAFCPQFHLSLQSGSNDVLKSMNRHYTTEDFRNEVNLIREYFPKAGITTDVICGFPTETDKQFNETLAFIEKIGFSKVHIFGYSSRKGTVASKFKQLDPIIIKERCNKCDIIATRCKEKYLNSLISEQVEVLLEGFEDGFCFGYSREYIKCYIKGDYPLNTLLKAKIIKIYKEGVIAE